MVQAGLRFSVADDDLELLILLPVPALSWDYSELGLQPYYSLYTQTGPCVVPLGEKHSADWDTSVTITDQGDCPGSSCVYLGFTIAGRRHHDHDSAYKENI